MPELITEFKKQMLATIWSWQEQLSEVQRTISESMHPYQQEALARIANVLRTFISEGKAVLADIAPLK